MPQHPRATDEPSAETLFRFRVISEVLALELRGHTRAHAVGFVVSRDHVELDGTSRRVSRSTLYRWLGRHASAGFAGLEPEERPKEETSRVLAKELVRFFEQEKSSDVRASVPELIARARVKGVLGADEAVDRTTVWRTLSRRGVPMRPRPTKHEGDMRRFAYPHRMQMLLCDGKHFRAGAARLRRVALFYLDDASRYALRAKVCTSEAALPFLIGLREVLSNFGYFDAAYFDNGSGFIAGDTALVFKALPAALIHGRERYPEGRGKIERFNQTAIAKVLRGLDGAAEVDPDCRSLELRLTHFLATYNDTAHESLDGQTPRQRFETDARALRLPESMAKLDQKFIVTASRRVSNDHVIQFGGRLLEAPRGLARERVLVRRNVITGALSLVHEGRVVVLADVDVAGNALARRGGTPAPLPEVAPVKTAAAMAFDRDFGPVVDADGGFRVPDDQEKR